VVESPSPGDQGPGLGLGNELTSPSPSASPSPASLEVTGADREVPTQGVLESVVDQVLKLFLNV
jgi:hypothetical protein